MRDQKLCKQVCKVCDDFGCVWLVLWESDVGAVEGNDTEGLELECSHLMV